MHNKYFLILIPLFSICLLGSWAPELNASTQQLPEQQVEIIQDIYRDLTSLSFNFSQETSTGGRKRHGAGSAVFYRPISKPGVMRWNYTEPDKQIILNDGRKLSIYTKHDNQMIVTSAEEMQSDITYAFFAGTRNLLDDFTAKPPGKRFLVSSGNRDLQAIQLVPRKPHAQVKALHLWFDKDFLIQGLIMEDHFDSITELSFTNIKLNSLPANSPETLENIINLDLPQRTEIISR